MPVDPVQCAILRNNTEKTVYVDDGAHGKVRIPAGESFILKSAEQELNQPTLDLISGGTLSSASFSAGSDSEAHSPQPSWCSFRSNKPWWSSYAFSAAPWRSFVRGTVSGFREERYPIVTGVNIYGGTISTSGIAFLIYGRNFGRVTRVVWSTKPEETVFEIDQNNINQIACDPSTGIWTIAMVAPVYPTCEYVGISIQSNNGLRELDDRDGFGVLSSKLGFRYGEAPTIESTNLGNTTVQVSSFPLSVSVDGTNFMYGGIDYMTGSADIQLNSRGTITPATFTSVSSTAGIAHIPELTQALETGQNHLIVTLHGAVDDVLFSITLPTVASGGGGHL